MWFMVNQGCFQSPTLEEVEVEAARVFNLALMIKLTFSVTYLFSHYLL